MPGIYDASQADRFLAMETETAYQVARAAARHRGLLLSPSSAANLAAAMRVGEELEEGVVVTIFPDNAWKYLNETFWTDDAYHTENPFD